MSTGGGAGDSLADAQATIARQSAEIEQLRARLGDDRFAHDLRDALTLASATGTAAAPVKCSPLSRHELARKTLRLGAVGGLFW